MIQKGPALITPRVAAAAAALLAATVFVTPAASAKPLEGAVCAVVTEDNGIGIVHGSLASHYNTDDGGVDRQNKACNVDITFGRAGDLSTAEQCRMTYQPAGECAGRAGSPSYGWCCSAKPSPAARARRSCSGNARCQASQRTIWIAGRRLSRS